MPAFYLTTTHSGHFEQPGRLPTKPTAVCLASNGLHAAKPTKPRTAFMPLSGHNTAPTVFIANKTLWLHQPLRQPSPRAFHNHLACSNAVLNLPRHRGKLGFRQTSPRLIFKVLCSPNLSAPQPACDGFTCRAAVPKSPQPYRLRFHLNPQSASVSASLCPTIASAARRCRP